ncbi:hypothetical protein MMIC_P2483 [Mariprofundus micogutta]|uniref:Uncharacterized protein n=1 Tax=Mariprofundus micogutta TaxID=1921010 RepID=A0A1L8CRE7_9PROT|nr:hypothetical protein [Mariprofundus micogutta]GAV21488.1 hypothetical protein MMIC_P2483 [Mariprofundus micogutta]
MPQTVKPAGVQVGISNDDGLELEKKQVSLPVEQRDFDMRVYWPFYWQLIKRALNAQNQPLRLSAPYAPNSVWPDESVRMSVAINLGDKFQDKTPAKLLDTMHFRDTAREWVSRAAAAASLLPSVAELIIDPWALVVDESQLEMMPQWCAEAFIEQQIYQFRMFLRFDPASGQGFYPISTDGLKTM